MSSALRSGFPAGGPLGAEGGGGGGGTPAGPGGGGGGGGGGPPADGAGGGGGGGGTAADAPLVSEVSAGAAGGAGGGGGGVTGFSCTGVGDLEGDLLSSMALRGRGGPMVPNRMLASCFALPAPVRSSSSDDESSLSEPSTDQLSSSGRARDLRSRGPVTGNGDLELSCCCCFCCCARRWKGFVDWNSSLGEVTVVCGTAEGEVAAWSADWLSLRK